MDNNITRNVSNKNNPDKVSTMIISEVLVTVSYETGETVVFSVSPNKYITPTESKDNKNQTALTWLHASKFLAFNYGYKLPPKETIAKTFNNQFCQPWFWRIIMTLQEWSDKYNGHIEKISGGTYLLLPHDYYTSPDSVMKWELHHLSDYIVSSSSGPGKWMVPK